MNSEHWTEHTVRYSAQMRWVQRRKQKPKKTKTTTSHRKYIKISIKLLETMIPSGSFCVGCCCRCCCFCWFYTFLCNIIRTQHSAIANDLDSSSCFEILSSGYQTHTLAHCCQCTRQAKLADMHRKTKTKENWNKQYVKVAKKSKSSAHEMAPKDAPKREIDILVCVLALHCAKTFSHNHVYLLGQNDGPKKFHAGEFSMPIYSIRRSTLCKNEERHKDRAWTDENIFFMFHEKWFEWMPH